MKKLMMLTMCALASGAAMAVPVEFRDYDANTGTFTNAVRECTMVTATMRELKDGWYAVAVATTNKIENGLDISGTAHLILCDGALFEVGQPAENRPGIRNEGTTLVIYGQTAGSGTLEVKGGNVGVGEIKGSAGIGGRSGYAGGTVIINGGKVIATSDSGGAAIGGGFDADGGTVTINGGMVAATNSFYGAGIGGGRYGSGGTVTINGGTVTAVSKRYGAGIGGGSSTTEGEAKLVSGGTVTINGGTVTAIGGGAYASGIGAGGKNGIGAKLTINGGTVTARGDGGGADIGGYIGQTYVSTSVMTTITGGAVNASNIVDRVAISGGIFGMEPEDGWLAPDCLKVENPDEATKAAYPWAVVPPCVVMVGNFPRGIVAWTSGDGSVTNVIDGTGFKVAWGSENVKVIFTAKPGYELVGDTVVDLGTVTADITFGSGSGYKLPSVRTLPVEYVDADGVAREKAFGEFTKVTASTKKLADGKWYAVIDDVTLTNSLPVEGSAHLILCDWATLAITNSTADAAISIGSGASLTVYGQTADTGRLAVLGGNAGIGGKTGGACGAVTIHGGTISASAMANKYGAGIGSGALGSGGSVTITGGRITAQGGDGAEDIGSGWNASSPCAVAISGGVFAREPQDDWLADHFLAFDNSDPETCGDYPYAVLPSCKVTIGACPAHVTAAWTVGDGSATNAIAGEDFEVKRGAEHVRVIFMADEGYALDGEAVVELDTETGDIVFGVGYEYRIPRPYYSFGDIPYLDWNGSKMTNAVLSKFDYRPVTADTRELADGWYAVTNAVALPGGANLTVTGNVHLVLCDGASLTIPNPGDKAAGIAVEGENRLSVYGQRAGTGVLTAQSGHYGAGIGSGYYGAGGTVTINGGKVVATGNFGGAGIGGGFLGACGTVTIHGGTVVATGGNGGAGIGGSYGADGGTVTIQGGTVTATGGSGGAGIGGGHHGAGGTVTIHGGAVCARGAEGLGGGQESTSNGTVQLYGGIFWAKPKDEWLAPGFTATENPDEATKGLYPYAVVAQLRVSPDLPAGPYSTAEEATNAMAVAAFVPSERVMRVLTTGLAQERYAGWFGLAVTGRERVWYVEAVLTEAAKSNLVETATAATRQIPVAAIAALAEGTTTNVTANGCEPGFYYTLYGATGVRALPETGTAYRAEPCGVDGEVVFPAVAKPSDAAGFFSIGASVIREE